MKTTDINKSNKETAKELENILEMPVSYDYTKRQQGKFTIKSEEDHFIISVGGELLPFKAMSTNDIFEEILYIFKLDEKYTNTFNELFSRKFKRKIVSKISVATKYL
ncbi:MAG: hypothetical protein PHW29_04340 [Flavobacterium sp.]|nr:hypothetical protein [Flavobacterium sp.]